MSERLPPVEESELRRLFANNGIETGLQLFAEIDRLRARCEEHDWMHERIHELIAENDRLQQELNAMRDAAADSREWRNDHE